MSVSDTSRKRSKCWHTAPKCRQLMTVPGSGPIIASAMVAAIGNAAAFTEGRDFAAWLGLVPKQMSTGDRTLLGRISKRAIATSAPCSCRVPALFCSDQKPDEVARNAGAFGWVRLADVDYQSNSVPNAKLSVHLIEMGFYCYFPHPKSNAITLFAKPARTNATIWCYRLVSGGRCAIE